MDLQGFAVGITGKVQVWLGYKPDSALVRRFRPRSTWLCTGAAFLLLERPAVCSWSLPLLIGVSCHP